MIFYFSGHGIIDENNEGYIAPYDMDPENPFVCGINMEEIRDVISKSKNKASVAMILDCCYAGIADGDDGKSVTVLSQIGITPLSWKDHSLDKYGLQEVSPLHTHDNSGTIHVESNANRSYTLGEFLNIWGGLDFNGKKTVKATLVNGNGSPISDYRNLVLRDGQRIRLEIR